MLLSLLLHYVHMIVVVLHWANLGPSAFGHGEYNNYSRIHTPQPCDRPWLIAFHLASSLQTPHPARFILIHRGCTLDIILFSCKFNGKEALSKVVKNTCTCLLTLLTCVAVLFLPRCHSLGKQGSGQPAS